MSPAQAHPVLGEDEKVCMAKKIAVDDNNINGQGSYVDRDGKISYHR